MPKHVGEYSEEEWVAEVTQAKRIWENYKAKKNTLRGHWESSDCPMTPRRFYNQCTIKGFCETHGWTYEEYVTQWKQRPPTSPPPSPVGPKQPNEEHLTLIRRYKTVEW